MRKYRFRFVKHNEVLVERIFIAGSIKHAWEQAIFTLNGKEDKGSIEIKLIEILEKGDKNG